MIQWSSICVLSRCYLTFIHCTKIICNNNRNNYILVKNTRHEKIFYFHDVNVELLKFTYTLQVITAVLCLTDISLYQFGCQKIN